jgi:hypothetical protein
MVARDGVIKMNQAKAIQVGDQQLVPVARSVFLPWPKAAGGFVYNRAHEILVRTADGRQERLPIRDYTRRLQILMLAYAFASILIMWLLSRR